MNEVEIMGKHSGTESNMVSISDEEFEDPPSFSLATLGLQRVGSAPPPKPQSQQPLQALNARGMPARIRKRNRLFFDENIINDDKPLRMSLSPRKAALKASLNSSSPTKSPIKLLKKRKGIPSRYLTEQQHTNQKKYEMPAAASAPAKRLQIASNSDQSCGDNSSVNSSCPGLESKNSSTVITTIKNSSPSTTSNLTTGSTLVMPTDKTIGQSIGLRLRNLLKLPKAHKWVIFEWFYSFVDKPIFDGRNDFQICLDESFPNFRTRKLTRAEWQAIRSLIGKPRRCSAAFFAEERRELERKRQKMRFIQTRRSGEVKDMNFLRDLPDKIPLALPLGTRVTARIRDPQDGIFSGTIDAINSVESTYRTKFDRPGLGTHSIPDYEIVSENFNEMLPIQSITKDFRPSLMAIYYGSDGNSGNHNNSGNNCGLLSGRSSRGGIQSALSMNLNKSDPLLGQEIIESPFKNSILERENINGYPPKILETLIRLKRALSIKRSKLQRLSDMNKEAEMKASQQFVGGHGSATYSSSDDSQNALGDSGGSGSPQLNEEFQRRYASIVISMEKMNRDLQDYLNEVQEYATELAKDPQVHAMLSPSHLREKCLEAAEDSVQRNNQGLLKNTTILNLIKDLATVLLVASHLRTDNAAEVSKVLDGCIEEVRSNVHNINIETFQKHIQIHLHHIRLGIGQSVLGPSSNNSNITAGSMGIYINHNDK